MSYRYYTVTPYGGIRDNGRAIPDARASGLLTTLSPQSANRALRTVGHRRPWEHRRESRAQTMATWLEGRRNAERCCRC